MRPSCSRCNGSGIIFAWNRFELNTMAYAFQCSHSEIKALAGIPYWDYSKESSFIAEFVPEFASFKKNREAQAPAIKSEPKKFPPVWKKREDVTQRDICESQGIPYVEEDALPE